MSKKEIEKELNLTERQAHKEEAAENTANAIANEREHLHREHFPKVKIKHELVLTPEATFNRARKNLIHLRALVKRSLNEKNWRKVLALTVEISRDAPIFQNFLTGAAKSDLVNAIEQFSDYNPSGNASTDLPSFQKSMQTEVAQNLKNLNDEMGKVKLQKKTKKAA